MSFETNKSIVSDQRIGAHVKKFAPRVSIIIPAYNIAEFIAETLDSIRGQTFTDYETILINDGSPDSQELEKTIAPYLDEIIYIKQKNSGTAAARNAGIKTARGEFLAFLDGDDVWLPHYLSAQLTALETKKCDLIYCRAQLFGQVQNRFGIFPPKTVSEGTVKTESLLSEKCSVITSGTIVKRDKVLECNLFDEELPPVGFEDFDLWFRMAKQGARLDYQNKVLLKYRIRSNSLSGSNVSRIKRNLIALDICAQKYALTQSEQNTLIDRREFVKAQLKIEEGKYHLIHENFAEASESFREANQYFRKFKYSIFILLLEIKPKLILNSFKKMRPTEVEFIHPTRALK